MVVVTADTALKRAVKRLTTATGASADFVVDANAIPPDIRINLAIIDARRGDPTAQLLKAIPPTSRIVFIIQGDSLVSKLHLMGDPRVTSLFCYDAQFDDDEFISSATKGLRGEVFGLQKYFPWGVTTFAMKVQNYDEKGRAIETLLEYATLAGCRGPVKDRIQLVCDELMMNALYHAPLDENGNELYGGKTLKELAHLERVSPIQVQYGCSGRYFGVSVRDAGGSLSRAKLLEYLLKAKSAVREIETKALGAGLGLVSTLKSVSKLVFNIEVRSSTEVIALFDMELFAKGSIGPRLRCPAQDARPLGRGGRDDAHQTRAGRQPDAVVRGGRGVVPRVRLPRVHGAHQEFTGATALGPRLDCQPGQLTPGWLPGKPLQHTDLTARIMACALQNLGPCVASRPRFSWRSFLPARPLPIPTAPTTSSRQTKVASAV
jgi:hypothetical protein